MATNFEPHDCIIFVNPRKLVPTKIKPSTVPESSLCILHSVQSFYRNNIAELLWYGKILFFLHLYLWGVAQCEYAKPLAV